MSGSLPPVPIRDIKDLPFTLQEFLRKISNILSSSGISWSLIDFTGSSLSSLATRNHSDLQSIQGGTVGEYYHLTNAEKTLLTGTKTANKVLSGPSSGADALPTYRSLVANDLPTTLNAIEPTSVKPQASGYISSDGSVGISTTITTASLVGKTITIKDGIITGFS